MAEERLQPPTLNIFKTTAEFLVDLPVESIGAVMADALQYYLFGEVKEQFSKTDVELLVQRKVLHGLDVDAETYTKNKKALHDRAVKGAEGRYHKEYDT